MHLNGSVTKTIIMMARVCSPNHWPTQRGERLAPRMVTSRRLTKVPADTNTAMKVPSYGPVTNCQLMTDGDIDNDNKNSKHNNLCKNCCSACLSVCLLQPLSAPSRTTLVNDAQEKAHIPEKVEIIFKRRIHKRCSLNAKIGAAHYVYYKYIRKKSSLDCFDKLPSLKKERRNRSTLAAHCVVNHSENTHTVHWIKVPFYTIRISVNI